MLDSFRNLKDIIYTDWKLFLVLSPKLGVIIETRFIAKTYSVLQNVSS